MTGEIDHVAGGGEHALGAPSHVTADVGQGDLAGAALEAVFTLKCTAI
jgi:hypothetical protein